MKRKLLHRVGMAALATSVAINTAVPAMAVEASGSNSGEITSFAGEGEPTDEGEPTEEGEPTGEGEPADEGEPTEEGEPTDGKTPTDNIKIPEPTDILTNSVLLVQPLSNESDFVISDDGVLTGYNGSDTDVVIPDSVTKIGDRAFYNNTTIESVTIPSSVAEIGSNAFGACSNLATINFSSDENLKTIGDDAFMNTAVESLSIPEGVETIGDTALYGTNLKSVFLPSTLTKLGNSSVSGAFSSSSRSASPILTEITIASGNSVYKSVDNGIYSADGKTIYYYPAAGTGNYTIDSGTETIDDGAFRSSKLSEVIIPEGVETIGANSFDSSSITSLSLPSTVKTIGDAAFYGASSLAKVELNEGLETIGSDAFGYIAATDLTIPSTVALIESPALDETIVLPVGSKITFLGKNTVIESGAIATYREVTICGYEDSTAQEYVENQGSSGKLKFEVLGSSATVQVTAVNINKTSLEMTVNGTEQLTAKVEPDNATNKNVTWTVEQTGNVVEVDSSTGKVKAVGVGSATIKAIAQNGIYGSCSVTVKEASQADGFVIENGVLKSYTGTDSSITIPDTVTVIGDGETSVLSGNSTVLSVTIPTSVTEIAKNAFSGATALTQITFQDGSKLTKIGDNAFNGAYVESISIPEGVTEIGAEAFLNAHQLKSVYFPSTVTEFGDGGISALFAAENASPRSLEEITIGDGNSVYMTYDGVVYSNDGETLIYCPPARTKTLAVKEGTKTIAPRAVYKSSITSLILNEGLESISEYAFGHSKITELTVPASVKTIDDYAFYFSQITSVTLNEGLETIGKSVFYADNLFGLEIPSSVKSVGSELLTFENGKGKDCWVKINGRNTTLAEGFIPDIWPSSGITVYGYADSTADKYVKERREADEKCVITFKSIDDFVPVESVKVTPSSGTLKRTETLQLKVDVLPQGSQGTTTSYKSSDTSVATVDKNGLITAVQPGKAKITVSVSGKTAECQIEVVKADGESDFTINEKGEITAFIGADITNLVIPSDVNGTAVTGIAQGAFANNGDIKTVVIPANVKTIGQGAFKNCSGITQITIAQGVESIGNEAFMGLSALSEIKIPEGITTIPKDCFNSCTSLTKIELPSSLKTIEEEALRMCSSLTTLTLNEGLVEIKGEALLGVPISTLHLPSTLTSLGTEYIGDVFEEAGQIPANTAMKSITVASGNTAFTAYDGLLYDVSGTKVVFCPRGATEASVKSGTTEIGDYAFFMCFDLITVNIPDTVTKIGDNAFHYCEALKNCTLPKKLEYVGNSAFFGCEAWSDFEIPESVSYIGPYGFAECAAEEINVPEGVTRIEQYTFYGYETTLEKVTLPSTLTYIGDVAFGFDKELKEIVIPEGVTEIGKQAFSRCDALTSVTLPSTLTTIREGAFQGKDDGSTNSLTEIYIPSTVTLIEPEAFAHREKSLTIITDSYTSAAAEYANENGFNLKLEAEVNLEDFVIDENGVLTEYKGTKRDITLPDTVKIIGEGVFAEEEGSTFNLKSIVIPSSVTEIRKDAFNGSSVEEVVFAPSSNLETIGESAFAYCTKLPSIKLPSSLKTIGERAFDGASLLEGISVPSSVESIGDYAFNVCTELRYVDFSDNSSLKTIGDGAFYNCFRLTEINVPEGVEEIGDYAFRISQGLTKLTLPSTLTKFGSSVPAVFGDLKSATLTATDSLTEIEIAFGNTVYMSHNGAVYSADGKTLLYVPSGKTGTVDILEGTESIGEYSFMRSKSNHVNIPETVKSIGKNAFVSSSLTSVEIPSSVESIAEYAFFNCSGLNSVTLVEGLKTIGYGAFMETDLTGVTVPASLESMEEGAFDSLPNGGYFKVNGMETAFNGSVIPYYREITVYGHAGSTSEEYVNSQKATYGSCKLIFEPIDNYVEVEEIVLSDDYLELNRFDTYKLSFEVKPENATYSGITFKSLNTSVATVDKDGNITAVSAGETTIQAISPDGATAQCLVKVISDGTESDFIIIDGLITGYRGSEKEIVIPDEINGVKVEGIADKAFYNNDNIISVVMPEGLKTIGKMAFADCGNLSLVEFNSDLESIGENAFYNCGTLKSVSLPEGLKSMERGVFEMCEQLMYADIPSSLKEIPEDTFNYDWRLKEIIIPEGVEIIGKRAFYECEGAERLVISSTVKTIGEEAFVANVRLKEIIIPEGVETIEQKAFMSCTAVTTVSLPSTLKTMGGSYAGNVFEGDGTVGCENMEVITVADENPYFASKDGLLYNSDLSEIIFCPRGRTEAVVADSVTKIADNAFFFCKKLEKVTLPDGITEIGESAFQDCISLESLKLPESLVTIGDSAFGDCYVLKELSLPNNVETIGNYAVSSTSISEISIPNSVKYLGNHAFSGNTSLKSIYIPSTVLEIGEYCLQGCAVDLVITTDYKNSAAYRYAVDNNIAVNVLNSSSGSNGEDESDQSYSGGSSGSGGSLSNISSEDESQNSVEIVTSGVLSESEAASAVSKAAENDSKQIAINSSSNFATMPRAMIESVLSETSANIVVKTSDGTVAVLKDTLKNLSAYDAITVGIDGGRVYVSSNGEYLSGIGEIIITVPYKENETTGNVAVEITKDNGEKIIVENVYDGNGSITFSADGTVDFVIIDDYKAESESSVTENPFKDIDGHWAENAILAAYEKGIFSGTGNDTFSPDDNITRGMIASAVYRMSGGTEDGTSGFNDVKTDAYYSKAVAWGSKNGIFSGYENGLFQPEKEITREEMALIAYKYALYGGKDISAETTELFQNFSDSNEISDWSKEAINYCVEAGIMSGRTDGTFDPKGKATRAEAAGVLTSLLSNMQDL